METKQLISLSSTKGEHVFTFHIPVGTTWGNAVDSATEILAEICNMAKQSMDAAKPAASPEAPVEPTIVEEVIDAAVEVAVEVAKDVLEPMILEGM